MGWFDEGRAPPNESETSDSVDYDELDLNQRPEVEEIEALLNEFEIFVNIDNVEDFEQEDMYQYFAEETEAVRQQQLKSLAIDELENNYDLFYNESNNYEFGNIDYHIEMSVQSPREAEQIFRNIVSLNMDDNLYDNDPLNEEEIAYEIMELGQLVWSEYFGDGIPRNEEEYVEYPKGNEE